MAEVTDARWKILATLVHVAVMSFAYILILGAFVRTLYLALLVALVVGVVAVYLKTGIPNVLLTECPECGELRNGGMVRCTECGEQTRMGERDFPVQFLWFLTGYSFLLLVGMLLSYGILSPDYSYTVVLAPLNPFLTLPLVGVAIAISMFLFTVLFSARVAYLLLGGGGDG